MKQWAIDNTKKREELKFSEKRQYSEKSTQQKRSTWGVHSAGKKAMHVLQELGFGATGVTHNAHVEITTEVDTLGSLFVHSTKQHE